MSAFNYKDIYYVNYSLNTNDSSETYKFFSKTLDLYLTQNVTELTRTRGSTQGSVLDYIFTNEDMLVDNLQYLAPLGKSDHVRLVWNYIISVEDSISNQNNLNYWKSNYEKINEKLMSYDWKQMLMKDTTEEARSKLKTRRLLKNFLTNWERNEWNIEQLSANVWNNWFNRTHCSKRSAVLHHF